MALDTLETLDTVVLDYAIGLEGPEHGRRIHELTDRAFGPGRYVKTAERLREDSQPIPDLSFIAGHGEKLVGSVRLWPVFVYDFEPNHYEPLAFLGPIVVDPPHRGHGIGKALIGAAVEAAFAKGLRAVLLVGAQSFFTPFGFHKAEDIAMPGPVDPARVLIRYARPGLAFKGQVCKVV